MSICSNCEKTGKKSKECFTQAERIFILSSATVMLRSVMGGRNNHDDKLVANSIITKLLLSLDPGMRQTMVDSLQRASGVSIVLENCPHGLMVIS